MDRARRGLGAGGGFGAGFWLINQYVGLSVKDTFKTWSLMETFISVVGFAFVLGASLVV